MRRKSTQAGFTLTETILVLGVIGLIVGAVWLAYGVVNHMKKSALGEQQITDLLQAARNYMLQANENNCTAAYYGVGCSLGGNEITNALVVKGLMPPTIRMTYDGIILLEYDNEQYAGFTSRVGGTFLHVYTSSANPYGTGPVIGIFISDMFQQDCVDIINAWAGSPDRVARSGLIAVAVNQSLSSPYVPIPTATNLLTGTYAGGPNGSLTTVTAASTGCTGNAGPFPWSPVLGDSVSLYFRLNP